jgi:hypothetical protein
MPKVNMVNSEQAMIADKPDDTPQSKEVATMDQATKPITIDPMNPDKVTHIGTDSSIGTRAHCFPLGK